jgi:hypothetical protein
MAGMVRRSGEMGRDGVGWGSNVIVNRFVNVWFATSQFQSANRLGNHTFDKRYRKHVQHEQEMQ